MAGEPEKGMREAVVSESLRERIRSVSHFVTDVDGVLTDGRIIMDDDGREIKHFHVRDGHGLKLLQRAGIRVILLTGRTSPVVSHRARDLGIEEVYQGAKNKVSVLEEILARHGIDGSRVAYMGDDIVDAPVFRRVGFSAAVADAPDPVRRLADYVTALSGGKGAVREVCELILRVQDKWKEVVSRYEL